MSELVVLGGGLITSAADGLRRDTGVAVRDGHIVDVDDNASLRDRYPSATIIDARHLLLLPGWVNAHMHSYGLLAHGLVPEEPLAGFFEFLQSFWWPRVEDRLDPPMIEAALQWAACLMIRSGVTAFCDVLEAPNAVSGILDLEAEVVRRSGLRAVLMTEASERMGRKRGEALLTENARFIEAHQSDTMVRGMLCLHTSFTCSEAFVRQACEMREALRCTLHLHLSESPYEPTLCQERYDLRPVPWYEQVGLWEGPVLASQVVAVDEDELRLLSARDVHVAHMPLSNCEVGGGVAPVPQMIQYGMQPGIGSDGYINNMFEVMRGAFLIHKGVHRNPAVMPSDAVFRMATEWGAKAIGFKTSGSLAPGAAADMIGIDMDFDTPLTGENALDQVILFRNPEHVQLSIIGGRKVMECGEILLLDEQKARHDAHCQAKRLWKEA